jgi:hypothetical protein
VLRPAFTVDIGGRLAEEISPWASIPIQLEDEQIKTIWPGVYAQGGATVSDGDSSDSGDDGDSGASSDSSDSSSDSDSGTSDGGNDSDSTNR